MKRGKKLFLLVPLVLFLVCALWVFAWAGSDKPVKAACKADIEWQVVPEAEITQFDCELGTFKKDEAVIFKAGIKNVSTNPLRFRVHIFLLDMDKALGHLIPAKGKPPVLEPGQSQTVQIPFIKETQMPKKILVVVTTAGH